MFWLWADSKYIFLSCFYFTIFNASLLPSPFPSPINSWSVWKSPGARSVLSPLFAAEDQMYCFPPFACLRTGWKYRFSPGLGACVCKGHTGRAYCRSPGGGKPAETPRCSSGPNPGQGERWGARPRGAAPGPAERRGAARSFSAEGAGRGSRRPAARPRVLGGPGSGSPRAREGVGFGLGLRGGGVVLGRWGLLTRKTGRGGVTPHLPLLTGYAGKGVS